MSVRTVISWLRTELLSRRSVQVAIFLAILALGFLGLWMARTRLEPSDFLRHGYLGVFVVNLITCATILFPIPGEAINVSAGSLLNPLTVALVATVGATIGEMTSYAAGHYGKQVLLTGYSARYPQAGQWMCSDTACSRCSCSPSSQCWCST